MKEKIFKYIFCFSLSFFLILLFSNWSSSANAKVKKAKVQKKKHAVKGAKVKKSINTKVNKSTALQNPESERLSSENSSLSGYLTYEVKKGDTLYKIAKKYGVTPESLMELNKISPRSLKPGLTLKIPHKRVAGLSREAQFSVPQDKASSENFENRIYHEVKKGETLFRIAKFYETTVEEIKKLNHLRDNQLKPGQVLLVKVIKENKTFSSSPEGYIYHTVQEGETLYRISLKYNISLEKLKEINHLKDNVLFVGQKLKIPVETAKDEVPFVLEKPKNFASEREDTLSQKFEKNVLPKRSVLTPAMLTDKEEKALKQKFLELSLNLAENRYKLGGEGNGYLDCSAFVKLVYEELGIKLPRSSSQQYQVGVPVERNELIPGDLVFFKTRGNQISHVGIYIGDNRFIHISSSRKRISIDSLEDPYFKKRYVGAKRVLNGEVLEYFQDYLNREKREPHLRF